MRYPVSIVVFLLSVFVFVSFKLVHAEDAVTLFQQGNEAYRQQSYQKAYENYEQVLKTLQLPEVYYNFGNAAFKTNQLGEAIVGYSRSLRLAPRNPDCLQNLKYAKSLIEYRVDDKRNWYYRMISEGLRYIRFKELLFVCFMIYFALGLSWIFMLMRKRPIFSEGLQRTLLVILVIFSVLAYLKFHQTRVQKPAVVVQDKVDVRYGPSKTDKLAFSLVEGIQVNVEEKLDDWYRISLLNQENGWVPKDGIEII
ncbi:MAG: hypothetical protein HY582_00880 [Candidatus Omnitrophica bacterium]|nr:hypothetical protein [Candidatus Omnitrophota bacterium]